MDAQKLSSFLPLVCGGGYSQSELAEFIDLVQKISLSYLKYQEIIGKHIRWERRRKSSELEDLAIDCVAGLFMRNEAGDFVQLKRYFGQYLSPHGNANDLELLVLLRRLVIKKTKQELSRIFKERDPEGAKIIRNIRVAVKSANDLATFREMGREYIYLRKAKHPRAAGAPLGMPVKVADLSESTLAYLRKAKPAMPEKSLKNSYLDVYGPKDHVSTTIRKMLSIVHGDARYQNYLATDVVARLIRHTNLEVVRARLISEIEDLSPLDYLRLKEIDEAKEKVLQMIRQKLQHQYINSGKLTIAKGEIYYRTLSDVLDDITHSKKIESYFRQLRKYMPDLTQRRYRQEERTIFEYLGKLTKKWYREQLKDLL
jgi:hypothetical protein